MRCQACGRELGIELARVELDDGSSRRLLFWASWYAWFGIGVLVGWVIGSR